MASSSAWSVSSPRNSVGNTNAETNASNNEEKLRDLFRCFICLEKLQDAHLCPHCSKFCCYVCISKWLTERQRQCPHCRATLHVSELVNCRWFEEIAVQVEGLQQICSNSKFNMGGAGEQDICQTHQEKMSVYCFTCKCCICHQCALWGGTHSGHTFKKLEVVYESHVAQVKEEIGQLQNRMTELAHLMDEVEYNVILVRDMKEEKVKEIRNAVDLMIGRLDAQLKVNLTTLIRHKYCLIQENEQLEQMVKEVKNQMGACTRSQLIEKSADLRKMIYQLLSKASANNPVNLHVAPAFLSEIVPQYDSCTVHVKRFTQLQLEGSPVYSTPLLVNGLCWRLKIYPNGNGPARDEYLSVFLELTRGHPGPSKYEYRVQILHKNASKEISREFMSDFEIGECWGYNRFFPLDMLVPEGYLDADRDVLTLRFQVRPSTYYQRCRDQQYYINQLLRTHQQQLAHIRDLQDSLEREKKQNQLLLSKPPQIETTELLSTNALATIHNHNGSGINKMKNGKVGTTSNNISSNNNNNNVNCVRGMMEDDREQALAMDQATASSAATAMTASGDGERRKVKRYENMSESNDKIFTEMLKSLSPSISNSIVKRPSTDIVSPSTSSCSSSSNAENNSPLKHSNLSIDLAMFTESSDDDDGLVAGGSNEDSGGVSSANITASNIDKSLLDFSLSPGIRGALDLLESEAESSAARRRESVTRLCRSMPHDQEVDIEGERDEVEDLFNEDLSGENFVEYAEVSVSAEVSNDTRRNPRTAAMDTNNNEDHLFLRPSNKSRITAAGGTSASASAVDGDVMLISLLEDFTTTSLNEGCYTGGSSSSSGSGGNSSSRESKKTPRLSYRQPPVKSASVLETLLEPPRMSSTPLVNYLTQIGSAADPFPSASSSSLSSASSSSDRHGMQSSRGPDRHLVQQVAGGHNRTTVSASNTPRAKVKNNKSSGGGNSSTNGSNNINELLSNLCRSALNVNHHHHSQSQCHGGNQTGHESGGVQMTEFESALDKLVNERRRLTLTGTVDHRNGGSNYLSFLSDPGGTSSNPSGSSSRHTHNRYTKCVVDPSKVGPTNGRSDGNNSNNNHNNNNHNGLN